LVPIINPPFADTAGNLYFQFSTGCTFGKRNIALIEGEGLQVTFKKNNQKLTLKLKEEIIEGINWE